MSAQTAVRERPLLMKAPLVRATIDGRKTQTRRTRGLASINVDPDRAVLSSCDLGVARFVDSIPDDPAPMNLKCPYGQPGDRLWVKETVRLVGGHHVVTHGGAWGHDVAEAVYDADESRAPLDRWPWKRGVLPSIHMPRGLGRLWLELTDVRVQRLQEITEADARAEGCDGWVHGHGPVTWNELLAEPGYLHPNFYRDGFEGLWSSINGAESWTANPWVWALTYRVLSTTGRPR